MNKDEIEHLNLLKEDKKNVRNEVISDNEIKK